MSSQPAAAAGTRMLIRPRLRRARVSGSGSPPGSHSVSRSRFVLTDLTSVDRDLYYAVYVAAVFGFVGAWLRFGVATPRDLLTHHWRSGIASDSRSSR